jgi:excisionase family DNA binding protein
MPPVSTSNGDRADGDDGQDRLRKRRLSELTAGDRPLTTSELAAMLGMSATFVRTEIRAGYLRAIAVGHGRKRVFRIQAADAREYAERMGFL